MQEHLLLFDGECGLCNRTVQFILRNDRKKAFFFARLEGETAALWKKKIAKELFSQNSVILIENFQEEKFSVYSLGKGAFRILWLLGGRWQLLGWPFFLPACVYNWGYRWVARHRHRFFPEKPRCSIKIDRDRFFS